MPTPQKTGLIYGLGAYTLWGFFPLYFYHLSAVSPPEVLAHRICWSFLFISTIILLLKRTKRLRTAWQSKVTRQTMLLAAALITINWLVFIWAVGNGRVLESSFGYFITPLVSMFLAAVILKERLDKYRIIACVLAVCGVLWQIGSLGTLPWVSLVLACSFGCYGLVRKQINTDPLTGLMVETGLLLPFALLYCLWLFWQSQSQFLSAGLPVTGLLIFSGALTVIPFWLFAAAMKKLTLSTVGFLMYINPTIQFFTGVYWLDEPFSTQQFISFCFIWLALVVFSIGAWRVQS
ncbi:MAG: EamA family transporter RarD [Thiolinea sp.]